jgi:hypothetical protein
VRGLCLCGGAPLEHEQVDWKRIDREMAEYNAARVFRDANVFQNFLEHYEKCCAARTDLFESEPASLQTWRSSFLQNSLSYVSVTDEGTHDRKSKSVRFTDNNTERFYKSSRVRI